MEGDLVVVFVEEVVVGGEDGVELCQVVGFFGWNLLVLEFVLDLFYDCVDDVFFGIEVKRDEVVVVFGFLIDLFECCVCVVVFIEQFVSGFEDFFF